MKCNSCGAEITDDSKFCSSCGKAVTENNPFYSEYTDSTKKMTSGRGLKWAYFLGYFSLWLGAFLNFILSLKMFMGIEYTELGINPREVYKTLPLIRFADYSYGVLLLGLVALDVLAALAIIKFKAKAGLLVVLSNCGSAVIAIFYGIMASVAAGKNLFTLDIIFSIVITASMALINRYYFNNRKDVFIY
ncbi:MAG: zinc ribbon domain-containing protein [Lachnospiraceae bacterium]|nr:zinc ribbon domain-containing protein [Lachnospiraceae bacterium]